MDSKMIIFYSIISLSLIIEIKSIVIHPLNIINQNYLFQIDNSSDYYFYTSLTNVKINEHLSYFISKEITSFKISYYFLENNDYQKITDSDINNFSFNETLGFIDRENFFKTIFKTNNNQKGLLLKMKIISYENSYFNIFRIFWM